MKHITFDTNAYSRLQRGDPSFAKALRNAETIFALPVVLGELYTGFYHGSRLEENLADLQLFLTNPRIVIPSLTKATAHTYGQLFAKLKKRGTPIPPNDIWIAAHALELEATLFTFDQHFDRVPDLQLSSKISY